MTAYYNEIDPYAAEWLRNLIRQGHIAPGDVDERSIEDVCADDLTGYTQCHFFAGIGGWSYALRLAGWPDDRPVWTGSCPCQPFSAAGKGKGADDERHLWPAFRWLIDQCRPATVFSEQVANAKWADRAASDLEKMGYAFRAAVLPAYLAGKDHARYRFYFAGHPNSYSQPGSPINAEAQRMQGSQGLPRKLLREDGLSAGVAGMRAPKRKVMRGFGNAIVPQVAAAFIRAAI